MTTRYLRLPNNNILAALIVLFMVAVSVMNWQIMKTSPGLVTGKATTIGEVLICINHPPIINHSCRLSAYSGYPYTCDIDAFEDAGQNVTFYANTTLFDINPRNGTISFFPTLLDRGTYYINLTAVDNSSCDNTVNSTAFILSVRDNLIDLGLTITKTGKDGVLLNWTDPAAVLSYNILYTSDPKAMRIMDFSTNLTNISGVAQNYWNDTTAYNASQRFYRVVAVFLDSENISKNAVGKFDIDFIVNDDGSLGRKLFAIPFNTTYYVDPFISEMCSYSATVTRLNRQDPNFENYEAHSCKSGSYNNYSMNLGEAFFVYVNKTYNYTVVGELAESNLTLNFVANGDGRVGRNLFGIDFTLNQLYADPFLNGVLCSHAATITRLNRRVSMLENYESHSCNSGSYNNFTMDPGEGYFMYINSSTDYTIR